MARCNPVIHRGQNVDTAAEQLLQTRFDKNDLLIATQHSWMRLVFGLVTRLDCDELIHSPGVLNGQNRSLPPRAFKPARASL